MTHDDVLFLGLFMLWGVVVIGFLTRPRAVPPVILDSRDVVKTTSLLDRAPTATEIASACLSYDHSFGLMDADQRKSLEWEAAEWLYAWRKVAEENRLNAKVEVSK